MRGEPSAERPATGRTARIGRVGLGVAGVAYAVVASGLRHLTWPAVVALLVPAAAVVVVGARVGVRVPRPALVTPLPRPVRRAVVLWGVLVGAGLLWEAWAFFHQPAWAVAVYAHPTLSALVSPVLAYRPVRFAGWLLWLCTGYRLAVR